MMFYCVMLIIRTFLFIKLNVKTIRFDNKLLNNKKIIIAIPCLREQSCIEDTIKYFTQIANDIPIVIITTQKEIFEYNNKKVITTQDIVKNKILPKYKNVYWINYPYNEGYMADQLNYMLENLNKLNIFADDFDLSNIYLALYNADSKPSKNTFREIIAKINDGNKVIQQYSYCFKNYEQLNSILKGFAIYQSLFELKTGLINTGLHSKVLYTHVVGHGLIINLKLLKELGNFNTTFWCEDIYLSMQLKFKNIDIKPLIAMENIETPNSLVSLIKQNSVWFNTTNKYKTIYNDIKKKIGFSIFGLLGCVNEFRCAVNWLFFSTLIILLLFITIIFKNYELFMLVIFCYLIYIFVNILVLITVINSLENKNYKITISMFFNLMLATIISNLGPLYSLFINSKVKYKTER